MAEEIRITIEQFVRTLEEKLEKHGAGKKEAEEVARIFGLNAADGVISHSVLRVWRVISHYDNGLIVPGNRPVLVSASNAVERYDANKACGVISASFCMERACDLAGKFGIGMVALRNANHWMRGGYYGWLAADRGKVGICWTNTRANLPSWGSKVSNIGNNPFVMAVPCAGGKHLVLDSAMSQFSNGKLEVMRRAGKDLPVDGGYDTEG
ncbi:MAG: Ldh family oxidoreductase, partial [Spirochaetales bacterium]|nr:Ldh family oxidoreductase [Spirochaetales bacterium]